MYKINEKAKISQKIEKPLTYRLTPEKGDI